MTTAKVWKKNREFSGEPKLDDFKIVEEKLPALKNGEFAVEAEFLSVDPYMRAYQIDAGSTMIGGQVARSVMVKPRSF